MSTINPGDTVTLYNPKNNKRICIRLNLEQTIHTQWGIIDPKDIVGLRPGDAVTTHLGEKLIIFRPLLYEKIEHWKCFRYPTQIVRPRDWGIIISFSNIRPGSRVIEIGTGSGAFTAFLCEIVRPDGFVYSYESNPERAKVAENNLKVLNIPNIYTIKIRDVARDGLDEENVDAVFVDIPEPWTIVNHAYKSLKDGGMLICYVPTFNQIRDLLIALNKNIFYDIRIIDHFYREIQPKPGAVRPLLKSYVFSAFIVFARKGLH